MLDDTSRKLLRIMSNLSRVPSINELARLSGRKVDQVMMGLKNLTVQGFIVWDPNRHHELKIIQAWEHQPATPQSSFKWWEHD